jgi:hypothetical protein
VDVYEVQLQITCKQTVWVEADSAEEARRLTFHVKLESLDEDERFVVDETNCGPVESFSEKELISVIDEETRVSVKRNLTEEDD